MSTQLDSSSGMLALGGGNEAGSHIVRPGHRKIAAPSGLKVEKLCRSCRRNRRGAAAVEFAVVSPVLFLLIFGMIEFGRMVMVQQIITNAAREGARKAVVDDSTTNVSDTVTKYLLGQISGATTTPTTIASSGTGDYGKFQVTVSVPYSSVSWLPHNFWLGSKTLTATSVMRREPASN